MSKSVIINDPDRNPIYEIAIESDFSKLAEKLILLKLNKKKVCVVADSNTGRLYASEVCKILEPISTRVCLFTFPAGEQNKTLDVVRDIYRQLIEEHFDRSDYLVALGGGVVGDITGFAAATYLRGISFVQVPTTLLAQSDSSVGGKTGVDFDGYKNMVGAFCMPKLVYMNTAVLKSMDSRDYLSGMGEVIKHALIVKKDFLDWIRMHKEKIELCDSSVLEDLDFINCSIKGDIVSKDPTEKGIRSLLNFGHTLGHAIEKQKAKEMYHGECVAIGCVASAYISMKRELISTADLELIKDSFSAFNLPVTVENVDIDAALEAVKNDKKAKGRTIRFVLLRSIGEAFTDTTVTRQEMRKALEFVCQSNS